MGSAYTPGLTVSARTTITKTRRLPLKGDVLVEIGSSVTPDTVVARANLPGIMQTMKVAAALGVDAADVPGILLVQVGDAVEKGQIIARTKGAVGHVQGRVQSDCQRQGRIGFECVGQCRRARIA